MAGAMAISACGSSSKPTTTVGSTHYNQTLGFSECMRTHGVSGFPDPTLKGPSSPAGYSILQDLGGVILAVPSTINPNSPAFVQAAKTCNFSS